MLTATLCAASASACADCFDDAAIAYGVDGVLLRSIASAESDFRADAVNRSHQKETGTVDLGLMQINSGWLKRLRLTEEQLREPCTNVKIGAWILSDAIAKHGNTWEAVGAYNAACTKLKGDACQRARATYAWRVYRRLAAHAAVRPAPLVARPQASGLIAVSTVADNSPRAASQRDEAMTEALQ
jgi:hypothetical protein